MDEENVAYYDNVAMQFIFIITESLSQVNYVGVNYMNSVSLFWSILSQILDNCTSLDLSLLPSLSSSASLFS